MSTKKYPLPLKSVHDKDDCLSVSSVSSSSTEESFHLGELDLLDSEQELRSRSASTCCECSLCDDSDLSTCCSCRCCNVDSLLSASSLFSSLDSLLSSTNSDVSDVDLSECSVVSSEEDCRRKKSRMKKLIDKAKRNI